MSTSTTLYPLASQPISIDLDDGVKVNYPKFGAALKKIPALRQAMSDLPPFVRTWSGGSKTIRSCSGMTRTGSTPLI